MTWADVAATQKCEGGCGWEHALERIDELLDDASYEYAWAFLEKLHGWIQDRQHVTGKQKRAIHNICERPSNDGVDTGDGWYEPEFWK